MSYIPDMAQDIAAHREYGVVVERDEDGWYVASVPTLAGCHTQARSLDELVVRIREAIEVWRTALGCAGTRRA